MRKITILLFATVLGIGMFASTATVQGDGESRISFNSISKTEDKGTSVLIIPMKGQMSTDISIDAYEPLLFKIKNLKPDLIVFEMFCQDFATEFLQTQGRGDRKERNPYDYESMKELARLFRIKLKDIDQIMWIQDSCGGSSVLTFAWPDIYMSEKAKLEGTSSLQRSWNYLDLNNPVRYKFYQAATAHAKNIAELGGRSKDLIMTFVDPKLTVSGTYDGRKVVWKEGIDGDLVADYSSRPIKIYAGDAEQFAISKATVRDLDDILLAEGIREYHLVGEDLTKSIEKYKIDWRKTYEKTVDLWFDAQQYEQWATGEYTERYLRKQLTSVQQIIRLLKRWDAVGFRMMSDYGISKDGKYGTQDLRRLIKQLEEQLRQLRENGDTGGRRGGGGLAGSSGGGGAR